MNRLQDVSSETEETSKGSAGEGEGLVATSGDGRWGWGGSALDGGGSDGSGGSWDRGGDSWGGAVRVNWGRGWGTIQELVKMLYRTVLERL